jgi:hypothetical protein
VPIAQLPDYEVVKPVLGMCNLMLPANDMLIQIHREYLSDLGDWQKGIDDFRKLHHRANVYTSTVEDAVRRIRDGD